MATEPVRRNGYYTYQQYQFPSVTKITGFIGGADGLMRWACELGGLGVLWALRESGERGKLEELCSSAAVLQWVKEKAIQSLEAEQTRVTGFGKRVHSAVEAFLKKENFETSEWTKEEKQAVFTFKNFYAQVGFDPFLIEAIVYSPLYRFAGQLDLSAPITEEMVSQIQPYLMKSSEPLTPGLKIIDIKTGTFYRDKHALQLSAYAQAIKESYGRECTGGLIITIERENPEEVKIYHFSKETLDEAFELGFIPAQKAWEYSGAPLWYSKQLIQQVA